MNFSVVAFSTVPDTLTARRLFDLEDMDDKAVSKVLFHRRKQQTGSSEVLRWDQRAIASMSVVEHRPAGVRLRSFGGTEHSEVEMLHAYFNTAMSHGRVVFWEGARLDLPLIRFRSLSHEVSYPTYWRALDDASLQLFDVADWLSTSSTDRPTADRMARKLGFPGMLGHSEDTIYESWLTQDHPSVQAHSDIMALNTFLIALRIYQVRGEINRNDAARTRMMLKNILQHDGDRPHFSTFLEAWGSD